MSQRNRQLLEDGTREQLRERRGADVAHLSPTRCVFDVVFRAAASLDVAQVQLLVQDLDLRWRVGGGATTERHHHPSATTREASSAGREKPSRREAHVKWSVSLKAAIHNSDTSFN